MGLLARHRSLPKNLGIHLPAWHTVTLDGVPLFRAQAWALLDYRVHGGHLQINSADRRDWVIKKFAPYLHGQQYLYDHQHDPGFFPANPPNRTSHCLFSDGNPAYRRPPGASLPKYMLGIDAVNHPGGDASYIVAWLNAHGYHAVRPYPTTSERHHLIFTQSPANHARARLGRWIATGR